MRRNVPKVLVVLTDGRSQDDVKKSAEKLQHSGRRSSVHLFHLVSVFHFALCPPKLISSPLMNQLLRL